MTTLKDTIARIDELATKAESGKISETEVREFTSLTLHNWPLIFKALAQGDVGELLDPNNMKSPFRPDGHISENADFEAGYRKAQEACRAALAAALSTPDAEVGWQRVQGPVLDELREHSRLLSLLGKELQDSHYVTAETIYAVHSALGWDDATPTQEPEG